MKKKNLSIAIGSLSASVIFIIFGSVSSIIPNPFFARMSPVYFYDHIFLFLTSALSGAFIGLWHYTKKAQRKCGPAAAGGTIGGFLSFGCAICNKLLVLLLGISGITAYFMPIQPILGITSIIFLSYAVYTQIKFIRKS